MYVLFQVKDLKSVLITWLIKGPQLTTIFLINPLDV